MMKQDVEDVYELSPLQQGMLFHSLEAPETGVYLIQLVSTLEGELDAARFEEAWQHVVRRQPVLRTSFHWGTIVKPVQVVHRHVTLSIARHDWRDLSEAGRAERLRALLAADAAAPMPLERAPLIRLALLQTDARRWQMVWSFPHILLEGWSASLVLADLFETYRALGAGEAPPTKPAPRYRDYIAWLQRQDAGRAQAHWRTALAGFTAPTPLPGGPSSTATSPVYARRTMLLPADVSVALQKLAREQRLTLSTIFQGAWAILLARYSGESDVLFGSVVSGREVDFPGVESLVGLCVNTLPFRATVQRDASLGPWLHALQSAQVRNRQFEYCSLLDIQGWSDIPRGTRLFESIFVFENWAGGLAGTEQSQQLRLVASESFEGGTGYPLVVEVAPGRETSIGLAYDARRLTAPTIERMLGHYAALLADIGRGADTSLRDLSILPASERQTILRTWNDTYAAHDAGARLHDLVLRQCARTPDAVAVTDGSRSLTYREVDERSGLLASHLRGLGVRPGVLVAVLMERSVDMVTALLAVLRADGAYVPLDPAFPQARLAHMLADAGCPVAIVDRQTAANLPAPGLPIVRADDPDSWTRDGRAPAIVAGAEDLAYVIYTSGSTGAPKGVEIPHGAVVNFMEGMQRALELTPGDCLVAVTTVSFDIAALELFLPLIVGAQVVIADRETASDGARLAAALEAVGATAMQATPATWRQMIESGWAGRPEMKILCGGETLPRELADQLLARGAGVWNLYGPTETTIWSTLDRVGEGGDPVSIGRPIANTQIFILDADGEPVPPGVRGDLFIAGAGLARGYHDRPDLTAERFVANPFAAVGAERMYRTGDQARYLADGRIEWLGRADHQVKVRGFRIELGEIEAALRQHPGVDDAVAIVREDVPGDRRIVAYVLAGGGGTGTGELRTHLGSRLPDYMIPSVFITVEAWPRTPNGKIDRAGLPAPDGLRGALEARRVPPRTPVEELVADIWCEVLGLTEVSVEDNFFELGGHSLLATRVLSRVRSVLKVETSLRQLFQAPTVAGFATALRSTEAARPLSGSIPRVDREGVLPLSFAQERLWFVHQLDPESAAYNLAGAVRLNGVLDAGALERAFTEIIRRHETLRSAVVSGPGAARVRIEPPCGFSLPVIDRLTDPGRAGETLEELLTAEARRPFDLTRAPLLRAVLVRLGETEHVLMVVTHHLVSDAWSAGILVRELGVLYAAFSGGGEAAGLADLRVQYVDFASWQREWLEGDRLRSELAYWKGRLEGAPLVLELPADRQRPAVQTSRGARHTQLLGPQATEALRTLGRREGATLYMTLLAAFQVLVQRYTGSDDFLIGSPIAGRTHTELEEVIGFFANTIVMRADLGGDPTIAGLLGRVRGCALDAYAHQDVPFEKLVDALRPERDPSRNPVVQVMFALQNTPAPPLDLAGLTWLPQEIAHASSPFDLTLFVQEVPQGLVTTLQYSTDLFEAESIAQLHRHLHGLLEAFAGSPKRRISQLDLLTPAERQQVLVDWNRTAVPPTSAALVHELFESAADRNPEALAVSCGHERLTYAELEERANRLANYLRAAGVGPEHLVGLCHSRSPALLVGMLGILKAGGAYLPMDPGYPGERLQFMLRDSGSSLIVTESGLLPALSLGEGVRGVCLDVNGPELAACSPDRPRGGARAGNLAYVIYTSGSTGRPKGVQIEHAGLLNLARWHQRVHGVAASDRATQLAGLGFDASVWEVWPYLISGASIHMPDEESRLAPSALIAWLIRERITIGFLPTPLLEAALAERWPAHNLRRLLTGGDRLHRGADDEVGFELFNHYGPTENSVVTTWGPAPESDGPPPIGRPVDNTEVYLLDEQLRPVPVGVPGELHIGGVGLSRGYVARPDLTAERFIPHPFSETPGRRLYKTGDFARFRQDGTLLFVGRMDGQVKLRGFRVELAEIEVSLARHPAIGEAAVVLGSGRGGRRLLAFFTVAGDVAPGADEIRAFLAERLPDYMVPSAFVPMVSLPLTANGKVDRVALASTELVEEAAASVPPQNEIEQAIADVWRATLQVEAVGIDDNFFDIGGHSLLLIQVHRQLQERHGSWLRILDLFRYPTIRGLAAHIAASSNAQPAVPASQRPQGRARQASDAIAIVGMAARFPGAPDLAAFWTNLVDGVESVTFFSSEELAEAGVDAGLLADPRYVPARALVDGIERFDAAFFGYSPREAELIDPQQRFFLECAWHALENAGCDPGRYEGRIGVFGGVGMNAYVTHILADPAVFEDAGVFQTAISSDKDFLATRVAYKLNLTGPGLTVQTGCSTSLVAVHVACRSLLDGECDMAMAGGVRLAVPQRAGYLYEPGGIVSPDGHCRAFDAGAQGTVSGSGVGVVVLKRLDDALADRDPIVAVIRGSAINNDGSDKVGYTAPSVSGQAAVIRAAIEVAGVDPGTITYVEAHGTGTALGDPIEIEALGEAFAGSGARPGSCAIGSVKTNIGHLDAAAGVAGLIKTALALQHATLPASLHFETPHPEIDFGATPFFVNGRRSAWQAPEPRRAGVSSFGIGGTNAHVVLEQAPPAEPSGPARSWQLLPISARSAGALEAATANLAAYFQQSDAAPLADVAFTLQTGRRAFDHRRVILCRDEAQAIEALTGNRPSDTWTGVRPVEPASVAFMFPGQGSQYPDMTSGIFETETVFREEVERCAALLAPLLGFDITHAIYARPGVGSAPPADLGDTAVAQPALFVVEYALARLWMAWGVQPAAMIGHSIGEYVAACLAGVFSLEDAIAIVAERGRLMQALPRGSMLAVSEASNRLMQMLPEGVGVAATNAPGMTVVSGPDSAVDSLIARLEAAGIEADRLHTSHAFHSSMMDPVLASFEARIRQAQLRAPKIPFVSNVTGTWITDGQATDPAYWTAHLREPVRFSEGVETLLAHPSRVLLEVGPGTTLGTLARRQPTAAGRLVVSSTRHPRDTQSDGALVLGAIARLWVAGVSIEWARRSADERRRRVPLPGYPFERQRYWIEAPSANASASRPVTASGRKSPRVDDWFYVPSWKLQPPPRQTEAGPMQGHCVILASAGGLGPELAARLRGRGLSVTVATPSDLSSGSGASRTVETSDEGYVSLFDSLAREGQQTTLVVDMWTAAPGEIESADPARFHHLMSLLRALGRQAGAPIAFTLVGSALHAVPGAREPDPVRAMLLGPCRVAPQEYSHLTCRTVDVEPPQSAWQREQLIAQLAAELTHGSAEPDVAFRGIERLVRRYDRLPIGPADGQALPLRDKGVYVITGGLGAIGLTLADYLARQYAARLVLVGRSVPSSERVSDDPEAEAVRVERLARVRALEGLGSEVLLIGADVGDEAELAAAFDQVDARFGKIDGVIHAAGVTTRTTMRPMAQITEADCVEQFRPKVAGVIALQAAIGKRALDFCLVTSSLSTVLGGPGLAAYAAGNMFLNAVARRMNATGPTPWVSLLWDGWSFPAEGRRAGRFDMQPAEGVETFKRALGAAPISELVVSTGDLQARLDQWVRPGNGSDGPSADARTLHDRPELASAYAPPTSETEVVVSDIWRTLLGIERVGVHDNFFELGGHSLLALRSAARLQDAFQIELPVQMVFEAPTVAQMAVRVDQLRAALDLDVARMEEMLRLVEDLPEEELRSLLEAQE